MIVVSIGCISACSRHDSENNSYHNFGQAKTIEQDTSIGGQMQDAVRSGEPSKVDAILQQGFQVNSLLPSGRTALVEAVIGEKVEVIKLLMSKGADPMIADKNGKNAIDHAGQNEAILRLIKPGDRDEQLAKDRQAIFEAIEQDDYELLAEVLEKGAEAHVFNDEGETPLTRSIQLESELLVRTIGQSAKTNILELANKNEETPLQMAQRLNLERIVEYLIAAGAKK